MRKNLKYITAAVAVLLIACLASSGVLRPQVSIFGSPVKVINEVLINGGQFRASQVGSFSAIIPNNILGGTNSAQGNYNSGGWGSSGALLDFGVKLDKNLFGWRLRGKFLNNNFLSAPFKNGKSTVLLYSHAKQYFIYALREIII